MKPAVTKQKNLRGRVTGYSAAIGPLKVNGASPQAATAQCEIEVFNALVRLDRGVVIRQWREHTYVIAPTLESWAYWLDTFSRRDYFVTTSGQREDAEDAALEQLAQNLWFADVDDTTFVIGLPAPIVKRLTVWIAFQRGFIAAKAKGLDNEAAHRAALDGAAP